MAEEAPESMWAGTGRQLPTLMERLAVPLRTDQVLLPPEDRSGDPGEC